MPPIEQSLGSFGSFEENPNRRPQIAIIAAQFEVAARRAFTRGNVTDTVAGLRNLTRFLDAQPYMEPEPWYYDPRECLGYVLLTHGEHGVPDPKAALREFTAALNRRPRTPWALIGAAESLAALVSSTAANPWKQQFRAAMKDADTIIASPCPQYVSKVSLRTRSHLRR